jgi:ornithine cyclodeaminase/alanine dehydrogenase-like protein (mu-crystallin family)
MQKRSTYLSTILGSLAMIGTLALSSPGVRVVRAADDVVADSGEVCEAGTIAGGNEVAAYLSDVQRLVREQLEAPRSDDEIIVLNNRGYNLGNAAMAFPLSNERSAR